MSHRLRVAHVFHPAEPDTAFIVRLSDLVLPATDASGPSVLCPSCLPPADPAFGPCRCDGTGGTSSADMSPGPSDEPHTGVRFVHARLARAQQRTVHRRNPPSQAPRFPPAPNAPPPGDHQAANGGLPAGGTFDCFLPASTDTQEAVDPTTCFVTNAAVTPESRIPKRGQQPKQPATHCVHWLQLGMCVYGASCRFVHCVEPSETAMGAALRRLEPTGTGDSGGRVSPKPKAEPTTQLSTSKAPPPTAAVDARHQSGTAAPGAPGYPLVGPPSCHHQHHHQHHHHHQLHHHQQHQQPSFWTPSNTHQHQQQQLQHAFVMHHHHHHHHHLQIPHNQHNGVQLFAAPPLPLPPPGGSHVFASAPHQGYAVPGLDLAHQQHQHQHQHHAATLGWAVPYARHRQHQHHEQQYQPPVPFGQVPHQHHAHQAPSASGGPAVTYFAGLPPPPASP